MMKYPLIPRSRDIIAAALIFLSAGYAFSARGDVKIDSFEGGDYAPQNDPVACWAASMSAALKVKGVDLDQDDIKRAVFRSSVPRTIKDPAQITQALNNKRFDDGVLQGVFATKPAFQISWKQFKSEIEDDNPFLVSYRNVPGVSAHVVVVYGAETDPEDRPINYFVWDPEPRNLGGGFKKIPIPVLDSRAWFFVIVRSAELRKNDD